jgi:hypothetical protein
LPLLTCSFCYWGRLFVDIYFGANESTQKDSPVSVDVAFPTTGPFEVLLQ